MLVPFGAIPDHLLKPLHVDTTLQYNVKKLKLPNSKDPSYLESTLILAATLDLPHSDATDCCCCNQTPLLPKIPKSLYGGFETDVPGMNLEVGAFQDSRLSTLSSERNSTNSDWLTPLSVLPLALAPAYCMPPHKDAEGCPSENLLDLQLHYKPLEDSVDPPDGVLQNFKDVYLGQPLHFASSADSTVVEKQCEVSHLPETNIPLFPMKEEDIDWMFVNPFTSQTSVEESINDDAIRYANLSNMGYIWQTDYSLDHTIQDSNWQDQSRV